MACIKVLCLASLSIVTAMAFIGVSSALATDEVTLCKELVAGEALCPKGKLLPSGTRILALAENPKLITSSGSITCEDSTAEIEVLSEIGASLPVDIKNLAFGKLPTPSLGAGCSTCTGGIHSSASYSGAIEVTGFDEFWLSTEGGVTLLNCFGFLTCQYSGAFLKFKIDRDATLHLALPKLVFTGDRILVESSLTRTGGSGLCPATATWSAAYAAYACLRSDTFEIVDCWVALDLKA